MTDTSQASGRFDLPETRKVSSRSLGLLCKLLPGITLSQILICRDLIDNKSAYKIWDQKKRSGGVRWITSPVDELKKAQRAIAVHILGKFHIHHIAHGFVRDRDITTNAGEHRTSRTVFNIDLREAFPSVVTRRVVANLQSPLRRYLRTQFGDSITEAEIADILWIVVKLCTWEGCIPQGAPTSPALLNVVCLALDKELWQLAETHGLTTTRYADDITLSTKEAEMPEAVRREVLAIVSGCGWKVNHKKTQYRRRAVGQTLEVTGLVILEDGRFVIPRDRQERYLSFFKKLLGQTTITDEERYQAKGIVVYVSRVYGGRLPAKFGKIWGKVKTLHGFQSAPAPSKRKSGCLSPYMPDLPDGSY